VHSFCRILLNLNGSERFENAEGLAGIRIVPLTGSKLQLVLFGGLLAIFGMHVFAQSRSESTTDIAKYAIKLPESSLLRIEPKIIRLEDRLNFVPANFIPRQNPFYVALPYNDIDDHHTKPEAAEVIPWFKSSFVRDGQSVCKGRWVAIRHGNKICYAQWEDVGPFQTDHWQYVFGDERPRANRNRDAGLDVSPAVREYLALDDIDFCDWKFVEFLHVPAGPWTNYGENNIFSRLRRPRSTAIAVSQHSPLPF
jgi:hypothetical protein